MVKITLILVLLQLCINIEAQKIASSSVPVAVMDNFKTEYPKAINIIWVLNDDSVQQVQFVNNRLKYYVRYASEGECIEKNQDLPLRIIPKDINDIITQKFKGFKIMTAKTVEKPKREFIYEIVLKKKVEVYTVMLSKDGKILSKIAEHD